MQQKGNQIMKQMVVCLAVVGGLALAACADGAEPYCAMSPWFSVKTGSLAEGPIQEVITIKDVGSWTEVPSDGKGTASVEGGKIQIDTDHASPLAFTPIATAEPMARLTSRITLTACDALPTIMGIGATAICVAPVSGGTELKWHIWNGTEWIADGAVSEEDVGQEFEVTLETDVTNKKVQYTAKKVGMTQEWTSALIDCSALAKQVASVSFYGSTELSDLSGVGVRKVQLAEGVDQGNIEVVVIQGKPGSGIVVDKGSEWMKTYEGRIPSSGMNETGANGLTYLQSYVLGLDPTKPMSKPFVTAAQNDKTDKITFRLGVAVNASSGARVSYCVKAYSAPDDTQSVGDSSPVAAGQAIVMDLPTSGAAARYYRVEVKIE